jgi:hypothetical protein
MRILELLKYKHLGARSFHSLAGIEYLDHVKPSAKNLQNHKIVYNSKNNKIQASILENT